MVSLLQVTQDPRTVLPLQWEELVEAESTDLQPVFSSMAKQIQNLLSQRDAHLEVWTLTNHRIMTSVLGETCRRIQACMLKYSMQI